MSKLLVTIDDDPEGQDPSDYEDGWTLYGFDKLHERNLHLYRFDPAYGRFVYGGCTEPISVIQNQIDKKLQQKFKAHRAFFVAEQVRFDSPSVWVRSNSSPKTDGVYSGLMIHGLSGSVPSSKTLTKRTQDADRFLKKYTDWRAGHVYGARVEMIVDTESPRIMLEQWEGLTSKEELLSSVAVHLIGHEITVQCKLPSSSGTERRLRQIVDMKLLTGR